MKNYFTINYWLLLMNDIFFSNVELFMNTNKPLLLPIINDNNINNQNININNENVNINILQSLILSDENV